MTRDAVAPPTIRPEDLVTVTERATWLRACAFIAAHLRARKLDEAEAVVHDLAVGPPPWQRVAEARPAPESDAAPGGER